MTTGSKPVDVVDGSAVRLLRIDDVAERLAVSRSMVWKLTNLECCARCTLEEV